MTRLFSTYRKSSFIILPILALFSCTGAALSAYWASRVGFSIGYYKYQLRISQQYPQYNQPGETSDLESAIKALQKDSHPIFAFTVALGLVFLWSALTALFAQSPQGQFVPPITNGLAKPNIAKRVLGPLGMLVQSAVMFILLLGAIAANTGKDKLPCPASNHDQFCQILNSAFAFSWLSWILLLALIVGSAVSMLKTPRALGGLAKDEYVKGHSASEPIAYNGAPATNI
ncbi:hypothetical protein OC845_003709 [Tilletia horrida]|nr:hypothetical protein OC845_003709 [Tilletia horrida]